MATGVLLYACNNHHSGVNCARSIRLHSSNACAGAYARDDGRYANTPLHAWFYHLVSGKGPCVNTAVWANQNRHSIKTKSPAPSKARAESGRSLGVASRAREMPENG